MNEARLKLGINQTRFGVGLTLVGPSLLWLVAGDFPALTAIVTSLLPILTILGLSNCRKAAPSVASAATIAWLSGVVATMLQVGVCLAAWILDIESYAELGWLLMIALLFHLVCLLFLLVFATNISTLVGASELAFRFRNLSIMVPIAATGMFYVFLIVPRLFVTVLCLVTLVFLVSLSGALGLLATRVSQPLSLE